MAKGFINISHSQNGSVDYYAREKECTYILSSKNLSFDKDNLLKDWLRIEQKEKLGDKAMGIRGRHDARVRTNYILSLPNELSPQAGAERIKNIIDQTPIAQCSYSVFIHKGEKNGIINQHAHLIVNERFLDNHKKDREMQRKEFLEKTFRPLFEQEFAPERIKNVSYDKRDRIENIFYYSDENRAKKGIEETNLQSVEKKAKQKGEITLDSWDNWGEITLTKQRALVQEEKKEQTLDIESQSERQPKETKRSFNHGLGF